MRSAGYNPDLLPRARELRRNMTDEERHLWYDFLRTYPVKFYRQRPIEHYIVDFCSLKVRLIVEVDGSQHYEPEGREYDDTRALVLQRHRFHTLRFSNRDINRNFRGVCEAIDETVKALLRGEPFDLPWEEQRLD